MQLATGKIGDVDSGVPLFAEDCNVIGRQALADGYFALAVEWFEEAARKACGNSEGDRISRSIAQNNIDLSAALVSNSNTNSFSTQIRGSVVTFHDKSTA